MKVFFTEKELDEYIESKAAELNKQFLTCFEKGVKSCFSEKIDCFTANPQVIPSLAEREISKAVGELASKVISETCIRDTLGKVIEKLVKENTIKELEKAAIDAVEREGFIVKVVEEINRYQVNK